ncbi:DNA-directed RNA polymerase I subunit RPA43 [Trichoderma gamsii]|uniref:DNA-directed RNA polymerase subunit n=1 Tax=Trichoderma gamsii TaxID=398673 RepID=A0A2P4ZJ00_9HYPO|nr:DNA-directed RNA polymerase I subunit RPA43 [Trichoderma gamsii]PON24252.1 DNA-directed RNA polymerase I subunit RPA43 [Trichoderma gamsii]
MSASIASPEPAIPKSEKKHKKDKASKSEKKRDRDEAVTDNTPRKHKKSKSASVEENGDDEPEASQSAIGDDELTHKKKKKEHKKKHKEEEDDAGDASGEKKKKKKSKKHADEDDEETDKPSAADADADANAMDVDQASEPQTSSGIYQPPDIPANPQFPFYSQNVSLYEPIYPTGWSQPVTSSEYQHLQHLKNKYVPSLRGVLINYKNVALGENPGRTGAATSDDDSTILKSVNEFAVGFGWITAEVELFVPSRGAWMEGSINLQTEGHIGVVCFGQFNASIEARRLPSAWKWVANEDPEAFGIEETASVITADDHGVVRQIHSTGFWVDGSGNKVKGKIRFRIRNFDVGVSGETSYLSLEGTMLDKEAEKALVREEAATAAMRKGNKGRNAQRRRAPEFAMTRFMDETEQPAEEPVAAAEQIVRFTD